jgi:hypothetical protein
MRRVKTVDELETLRGARADKPDMSAALVKEIREAATQNSKMLLTGIDALKAVAEQMAPVPVHVTVPPPEKVLQWEFSCKYDASDKLISLTAKAIK